MLKSGPFKKSLAMKAIISYIQIALTIMKKYLVNCDIAHPQVKQSDVNEIVKFTPTGESD